MKDTKARSFVTIMIVVAISALALRIAIDSIIKINISQNESNAQATLKLISTALENYAKNNQGLFPANFSLLTRSTPAYLDKNYIDVSYIKGYNYTCPTLDASGYRCLAVPIKCRLTGKTVYTINTGGSLTTEECSKKE